MVLSDDPFLQSIPAELTATAAELTGHGSTALLRNSTAPLSFSPVLQPSMAVSAALDADFFSAFVWVVPTEQTPDQFDLALFAEQLVEFGAIEPDEAATLTRRGNRFTGTIREIPFEVVLSSHLPEMAMPIVLHIDLSYFGPLYKNEITTPLFPTVLGQLTAIHQARWPVLTTTLSLSNLSGVVPLDSRFLRTVFSEVFAEPALLAGEAPLNWQRQKDIFYVENLFQYEKGLDLALAMTQTAPDDAGAQFALYKAQRQLRMSQEAFDSLDRAVALDPIYAGEYLRLAPLANEKGRADEAARMLRLAATALPDQPLIRLDLAYALLQTGEQDAALRILDDLIAGDWSPVYYPEMRTALREQRQAVKTAHAD
ncbi:MAG: tetratricopeptide repeat protein [Desulfuromonadales bacterium]|nr:tetratricopeptide repeat protein [Desulfuromonadales bacterium]